jgi:hypothetical protein
MIRARDRKAIRQPPTAVTSNRQRFIALPILSRAHLTFYLVLAGRDHDVVRRTGNNSGHRR